MTINERIKCFFERNEVSYQFHSSESDDELDSFEAGFKGNNGRFKLRIVTDEEGEYILILGFPSFNVPQKYMDKGIRAANLFNKNRLFVLCYVDPDDGEVVYRYGQMISDDTPDSVIERAVWTVCSAVDNETTGFMETVFRDNGDMN